MAPARLPSVRPPPALPSLRGRGACMRQVRVCKGCTLLAVGVVVGVPAGCLVPAFLSPTWPWWPWRRWPGPWPSSWGPDFVRWGSWEHVSFQRWRQPSWWSRNCRVRQPWGLALVAIIAVAVPLIVRVCVGAVLTAPPARPVLAQSAPLFGLSASVSARAGLPATGGADD